MKTEKVKYKDGEVRERLIVNPKEDNCPLCGTSLSKVGFTWQTFHGEASASCCGNIFQTKSYYVDEEKYGKEAKDFAESLDEPDRMQAKIDGKYLEAHKQAFEELGIRQVNDKQIHARVSEMLAPNQKL